MNGMSAGDVGEVAFRQHVREVVSSASPLMLVSYSRKEFGQSGDGHFSPIGGFVRPTNLSPSPSPLGFFVSFLFHFCFIFVSAILHFLLRRHHCMFLWLDHRYHRCFARSRPDRAVRFAAMNRCCIVIVWGSSEATEKL
jgi:hypothetical protein